MKGLLVQLDRLAQVLLPLAPPSQFLEKAFGQLRGCGLEGREEIDCSDVVFEL